MKAHGRSVWMDKKSGRWKYEARVTQPGGSIKKYQRTAASKQEAVVNVEALYQELTNSTFTSDAKFLSELVNNYLEIKKNYVKPSTLANNKYLIDKYVLGKLGNRRVEKLTAVLLHGYLSGLRPDLSTGTVNKVRAVLSGVFSVAVDYQQLSANPLRAVKPFRTLEGEKTQVEQPWSLEEVREVLKAFADTPLDFFIHATLTLGLRRGEALALKWSDLNLEEGWIDIRDNRGSRRVIDSAGQIRTEMTHGSLKTKASRRRLELTNLMYLSLMREKARLQQLGFTQELEDFIVVGDSGKPIGESSLYRIYNRVLAEHGIRRIRVHDNRHTAAVLALSADIDLVKVSYGLGHGGPEITKRVYAPIVPALSIAFSRGLAEAIEEDQEPTPGALVGGGVNV
jgi:integrase